MVGRHKESSSNHSSGRSNNNHEQANNSTLVSQKKIRIDGLDIKIIKELFHDPTITSTDIAKKHVEALSTIQRRRARLEGRLIKRGYTIDITQLGWRTADLAISVEKGMARKMAYGLVETKKNNVIVASLRIGDPMVDVMANVFYKDSQELHDLSESVKAMPNVTHVEWSEIIEMTESNAAFMIDRVLASEIN